VPGLADGIGERRACAPIYAAWERGDFSSTEWAHPEIEYVRVDELSPDSWKGLAGLAEGARAALDTLADVRVVMDDCRELDDARVLVLEHAVGRGKRSGLEVGQLRSQGAHLFHIHHAEVVKLVFYFGRDRAFADLGLVPEADAADEPG